MKVHLEVLDVKAEHLSEVCDVLRLTEVAQTGPGLEFRVRLPQPVDVHHAMVVVRELERRLPMVFTDPTTTEGGP